MSHRRKPAVWILILLFAAASLGQAPRPADTPRFFPMAVWYGGGKARAPMLERGARKEGDLAKDLRQIKALGFNTVRAWIDWASGEPAEGTYHFETLDVLLELAEEEGLKLSSRSTWTRRRLGSAEVSGFACSCPRTAQAIRSRVSPGYCRDHPGCARRTSPSMPRSRSVRAQPGLRRMGPVERAARHQLGEPDLHLRTPSSVSARNTVRRFRALAAEEVRHASRR